MKAKTIVSTCAVMLCLAAMTCAGEVVSSAAGGWFAVDARAVKDTTLEGGAIVAGETNLVLQCSANAWGAAAGGSGATVAYSNATTGDAGTIAEATTAETVEWTPNGPGTFVLTHTVATDGDPVVLSATFAVPGVTFTPPAVDHATAAVYTNGAEMAQTGGAYLISSNAMATVVYTTEGEYVFADGKKAATNELDTTVNPATVKGDLPKVLDSIKYVAPVYVDGIASNGIAYWTTNTVPSGYTVVTSATERVTWGTAGETSWYVVTNGTYQIDGGVECKGYVHLVLCDGAKLTVTNVVDEKAAIATDAIGSFTVYGGKEGTGILNVYGGEAGAGIGGCASQCAGANITLNGGHITAHGGSCGAGIGGGEGSVGTNITINAGVVKAFGGKYSAGIGGGMFCDGTDITINGGTVTATGGNNSAGIGGGIKASGSGITINGGTVTAFGSLYAAGIGGGDEGDGSDVTINGGTVAASGGVCGAAIGGGYAGVGSNITIREATVFASACSDRYQGVYDSPNAIGNGEECEDLSTGNTIDGSARVFFNLTGLYDFDDQKWIEPVAPMPETFEGFVIMTSDPAVVPDDGRVLAGGIDESGAAGVRALTWTLTNAVTAATNTIAVGGLPRRFASANLKLKHAASQLTLNVFDATQVGGDAWADVEDGECVIFGTGATWSESEWKSGNPLAEVRTNIRSVVVADGVTAIGSQFFAKFYALTNVTVAASVTSVGAGAFSRCLGLERMTFAGEKPTFGDKSFTVRAGIRMDGGEPVVWPIPEVTYGGNAPTLYGKTSLMDAVWTEVTDANKANFHFFTYEP